ncbi:hypothetical protein BDF22DRAFT_668678 [Syncephalis plumigaleata]|nr:hypothetical protein BDF22DRAFT_668678 [Syncephalis plumigaleata]
MMNDILKEGHDKYIIVLEESADDQVANDLRANISKEGGKAESSIKIGKGYHAIPATLPISMLQSFTTSPHIKYIEPDGEVSIQAQAILNKQEKS